MSGRVEGALSQKLLEFLVCPAVAGNVDGFAFTNLISFAVVTGRDCQFIDSLGDFFDRSE